MSRAKAIFNAYRHALQRGLVKPKPSRRAIAAGNAFLAPGGPLKRLPHQSWRKRWPPPIPIIDNDEI